MLRVGIWVESFKCTGILFLQWHGENFGHGKHLKFCHYQPVRCASKILYLPTYSTDFRNLCLRSNMLRLGTWVECFWCAGILLLQWQGENFAHGQHLKFCNFQPVPCASKNPISPEVFNRFSKSLPQLDDVESGNLGGKFQVYRYLTFAMSRWKLCASTTFEIFHFQPVHCASKNPISPKVLNRFSKFLPQLEDVESGHLGGKFQVHRNLFLQCQGENFAHRQHLKFCHYQPVHGASKFLYLQTYSTDFRKISKIGWIPLEI